MEHIVKYLLNPLQTGVHYSQFIADFSSLEQLIRDIAAIAKKHKSESKELIKTADKIKKEVYLSLDEIKENFNKALAYFVRFKECPNEILEYLIGHEALTRYRELGEKVPTRILLRRLRFYRIRRRKPFEILESHIFDDINDVVVITTEGTKDENVLLLEITTIKKEGLSRFHNFIKCIPHIGDTVKEIRKRKTYSSRYTFRPYPLAVQLWLRHEKAITVPKDLRDFLRASIRYHSEEEWRTSIILSAIAVESILADLYEEQYKEYAPNVPLGELYYKVKDEINFPSHITGAIEMVNEARISAVHRSRFPVSDREATNALYGATNFIMWYSSNF